VSADRCMWGKIALRGIRTAFADLPLHRVLVDLRRGVLGGATWVTDAIAFGRHHRAHVDAVCHNRRPVKS
jgi:hypothetical protein